MTQTALRNWGDILQPSPPAVERPEESQASLLRALLVIYLLGMLILLPVQFLRLPLNMALIDWWNALALPMAWLYLIRVRQPLGLPYATAMGLILLGGLIGTFSAPNPMSSLVVLLKEVYVYIWFVTLAALLASFPARTLRLLLLVWMGVAILHGLLPAAQFLSPNIWETTQASLNNFGAVDDIRPAGLFENANATALFQLMGFVPLLLAGPSRKAIVMGGALLFLSIVSTGSLGAVAAFLCGLFIAVIALFVVGGRLGPILKTVVLLTIAGLLLGGAFYFAASRDPDLQARFEYFFYGRAEGSAEGRFALWRGGIEMLLRSEAPIWGIGPEAFRDLDIREKQLHNDLLAFVVERGVLGVLGLVWLGGTAVSQAFRILRIHKKRLDQAGLVVVIFLAAVIAALVESQTHQIFHARTLWLVLAVQEALLFRMTAFESETEPSPSPLNALHHGRMLAAQGNELRG